jgi:sigma-B regulation protein RsbU (phosphoserine phosphatase)
VAVERPEWLTQMEGILETLNEGVVIRDDCDHIIYVNNCFTEMIGAPASELLGRGVSHFYSGEDYDYIMKQVALGQRLGQLRYEFFIPRADGSRLPVIISARLLEDPDGREFAVITFTDISEQKQAEAELRAANAQLEERQKEIEQELSLAARVQQSLTPTGLLWGHVAVEAFYLPVRTIGGDFGLVRPAGDGHLNLLVCDVSGHGISSALVANRIYSELMMHLGRGDALDKVLGGLNRFVLQNLGTSGFYVTLAAARLTDAGHRMTFAGAGHPPGMVVRPGGETRLLESQSMVLGLLSEAISPNATIEVELQSHDRVVLYTDGFTEVFDERGEMLEVGGLQAIVEAAARKPLPEMKQEILDRVAAWRHGPPADDMSLVLLEVL